MITPAPPCDPSQKQRLTTINLDEIVWAMSDMLDLVGIDDFYHGKRVAYMTLECMRLHTGDEARLLTALDAALLHDCGVSSTEIHKKIIAELDWDQAHLHCERGHDLLARHPLLSHLAPIVLYHHSRWPELVEREIPEETRLLANCLYLTDRVDALATGHSPDALLLNSGRIRETIAGYRGRLFSPQLVDTFLAISENEIFWLTLFSPHITYYLEELPIPGRDHEIDFSMLRQTAALFADIVDAKSPFTAEHSRGVARLAVHLADLCGLDQASREKLEIAGFLHDLGKLKVPDEILDKKGPLTVRERAVIIQHSFDTYQILRRIRGFETIARLAAFHHETLSGEGYPFHMHAAELAIESRIIAVADIFQALAQNRPYRASLPPAEIMPLLHTLAREQKLDAELVALAGSHLDSCWQAATGSQPDTTPARSR